jgi:hypothetical protein
MSQSPLSIHRPDQFYFIDEGELEKKLKSIDPSPIIKLEDNAKDNNCKKDKNKNKCSIN